MSNNTDLKSKSVKYLKECVSACKLSLKSIASLPDGALGEETIKELTDHVSDRLEVAKAELAKRGVEV